MAQVVTLGDILVIPGCGPIVLQQTFPPALTDCPRPLGGLYGGETRSSVQVQVPSPDRSAFLDTPLDTGPGKHLCSQEFPVETQKRNHLDVPWCSCLPRPRGPAMEAQAPQKRTKETSSSIYLTQASRDAYGHLACVQGSSDDR